MFSRIHRQFGTAGLVVSIIALIAALSGGAWAAQSGLNGKQKQEVKKIAKKSGKPGKQGPQGTPGAKGDPGAPGAAGAPGEKGAKGDQGIPGIQGIQGPAGAAGKSVEVESFDGQLEPGDGPCDEFGGVEVKVEDSTDPAAIVCNGESGFTDTLPPGKTETGAWGASVGAGEFTPAPISFAIPLAEEVDAEVRALNATPNANCPGTAAAPDAAPGWLCVYLGDLSGGTIVAEEVVSGGGAQGKASASGGRINLEGSPGQYASGTFAVTAPPAGP